MKKLRISLQIVASFLAVAAAVAIAPNVVKAGSKFDPHMAPGGLPDCMEDLNNAESLLEAYQDAYQDSLFQMEAELEACEANAIESSDTAGVPGTGQTVSYAPGDDGNLQIGIPLPVPRFTDNGDGTVTDNLTGLIWTQDANLVGQTNWVEALGFCNNMGGEWRLPNIRELQSLLDYSHVNPALNNLGDDGQSLISNIQPGNYWSSTTYAYPNYDTYAWLVSVYNGGYNYLKLKEGNYGYVWCVRGE